MLRSLSACICVHRRLSGFFFPARYESWWDVPVAEVSEMESVEAARRDYVKAREKERHFL